MSIEQEICAINYCMRRYLTTDLSQLIKGGKNSQGQKTIHLEFNQEHIKQYIEESYST